ncbi:hypothetical protein F5B21DRAFT_509972 [Xylaria acuta]|nr:hypothetical protein F5B21DRAFT_509972 [Xylaria acuta]
MASEGHARESRVLACLGLHRSPFRPQKGPWFLSLSLPHGLVRANGIVEDGHFRSARFLTVIWSSSKVASFGSVEVPYGPPSQPAASDDGRVFGGKTGALHQRIPQNQKTKSSAYSITFSRWPGIHGYKILVRTYSELLLSFPSDGLRAFIGIIYTLSRSFPGGFLYGMPEYFFDYVTTWVPYMPVHCRLVNGAPDPALPSWSWVG